MAQDAFLGRLPGKHPDPSRVEKVRDLVEVCALALDVWVGRLTRGAEVLPETGEPVNDAAILARALARTIEEHLQPAIRLLREAREAAATAPSEGESDEDGDATDPVGLTIH